MMPPAEVEARLRHGQQGFLMVVVPVLLLAILTLGFQMANRSRTAMKSAGTNLEYFQTFLCAQQCASQAVNMSVKSLERNSSIPEGTHACRCAVNGGRSQLDCSSRISEPEFRIVKNCHEVQFDATRVGILSECGSGKPQFATIDEDADLHELLIFQFGVFYDRFLEFENWPEMNVSGKVHSNDTILLRNNERLSFHDWVTSSTLIATQARPNGQIGEVVFARVDGSGLSASPVVNSSSLTPLSATVANWKTWKENHRVAYGSSGNGCGPVPRYELPFRNLQDNHGLIEWRNTRLDDDRVKRQKFAWRAHLIYRNGWLNRDLRPANLGVNPVVPPAAPVFPSAGLGSRVAMWEARDDLLLRLVPIDLALLQQRAGDSIIYLYDSLPDPAQGGRQAGGFLIHNASRLLRPLTVATNSRLVVLGNYNTDSAYVLDGGRRSHFPSALVSDAMIHLSPWFNPSRNSLLQHPERRAVAGGECSIDFDEVPNPEGKAFTLNSCVMTGMVSRNGSFNSQGGYNNLVRMNEGLRGVTYRKSGSMVCVWESRHSRGIHCNYPAPDRDFSHDPMYDDPVHMPPATPRLVTPALVDWSLVRD